jgi:hypothetical protein
MPRNVFISDLSSFLGSIHEVATRNRKFAQYNVREIEQKQYIVGSKHAKGEPWVTYNDPQLLLSLLSLVNETKLPKRFSKRWLAETIPLDRIVKWCELYQLPYENKDLWNNYGLCGFEVNGFRYRTAMSYSRFLLWQSILYGDSDNINSEVLSIGLKPGYDLADIKESLALYMSSFGDWTLQLIYNRDHNDFGFKLVTESRFVCC